MCFFGSPVIINVTFFEESNFLEHVIDPSNQIFIITPDNWIFDQVLLEIHLAILLQLTVASVVLQMSRFRINSMRIAAFTQARKWKVIVQRQDLLNVMKTLDVRPRFGVIVTAVNVLEHVHVTRDVRVPHVRMLLVIPKVDIAEMVRGRGFV